jgi:hypothetical protein
MSLDPERDAVMVLPGWESSQGAVAEVSLALWRGLPILDAMTLTTLASVNLTDLGDRFYHPIFST